MDNVQSQQLKQLMDAWRQRAIEGMSTPEGRAEMEQAKVKNAMVRCEGRRVPKNLHGLVSGGYGENGEQLRMTQATSAIFKAVDNKKRIIVLSGQPGTGKTVAACVWLIDKSVWYTYQGESGFYVHIDEVCDEYNKLSPLCHDAWVPMVIDDVGTENEKQGYTVDKLLQQRYREQYFTLITTNLSYEQFSRRYDLRTVSRMKEVGAWVNLTEVLRPDVIPVISA